MSLKNAIEIKNLNKTYRGKLVLDNVSFSVRAGTIHGFIGPNGAGKSTTINILRRLVLPDGLGRGYDGVFIENNSVIYNPAFNEKLGPVPAEPEFLEIEVAKHLISVGSLRDKPESEVIARLRQSGLWDFRHQGHATLSTGWKKILQLFTLSLYKPRVFILDEVMNGLDPTARKKVFDNIRAVRDRGGTVLISTHILSDLEKLEVDDITMIKKGKIVYTGPRTGDIEETYEKHFIEDKKNLFEL
jgi:ABC-2 type transport system ATP-binding protein